ncbi:MAG: TIGR04283 family arsenosugar biosynthesis glycosyltransferase [Ghiorsea sp.]
MKGAPSLAIVIPVYNEVKVLPKALKSLQELNVDELVFVDGGSTDGTQQVIEEAGFVCLQSEAGRAKQMNMGSESTISKIILYLHIDTSLSSSDISNIKKSYKHGYSSGRFNIKFTNGSITYRIISFFINMRSRFTKVSTGDQGIFVTRKAYEQVGGIPDLKLMEDVAFTKALKRVGRVACLSDNLVTSSRRWENHGVMKTVWLMWKLRFLFWLGVDSNKLSQMYRNVR